MSERTKAYQLWVCIRRSPWSGPQWNPRRPGRHVAVQAVWKRRWCSVEVELLPGTPPTDSRAPSLQWAIAIVRWPSASRSCEPSPRKRTSASLVDLKSRKEWLQIYLFGQRIATVKCLQLCKMSLPINWVNGGLGTKKTRKFKCQV